MKHTKRPHITAGEFHKQEVIPALAAGLNRAFPEFGFVDRRGEWWTATTAPAGFEDYGVRQHKLTANGRSLRSYKASAVPIPWTAYVLGRTSGGLSYPDFVEAVKKLAGLVGLDASVLDRERTPEEVEEDHKRVRRGDLLEDFVADAHSALMDESAGKTARDYLTGRGFKADDLEGLAFGVYTAPKAVEARLKALGFTAEEVEASGLVTTSEGAPLNSWKGRVVFPWRDEHGRILTVAARDTTGKVEDDYKYLYLRAPNRKGDAFGLDVAVRSATARREGLIVMEGLMDVVLLQTLGVDNVAALGQSGDYLTAERWDRLTRHRFPSFTLVMDNDPPKEDGTRPGLVGLLRALDNLSNVANVPNVHVVDPSALGTAKDPDELIRAKGLDAFRALLKARRPWFSWRGEALLEDVTPSSAEADRYAAAGRVLNFVEGVRGSRVELEKKHLLTVTAERTNLDFNALDEVSITEAARRRREDAERAVDSALRTAQADLSKGVSVEDVVGGLDESLVRVRARSEDAPPLLSIDRILEETRNEPDGLVSGWAAVDALGVRFVPGELALVAGRVGHGKTSVVVNLLKNWLDAEAVDGPVVFYSLEEPERRIVHRLFALETCALGAGWTAPEVRAYLKDPKGTNPHAQDGAYPDEDCLLEAIDRVRTSMEDRLQIVWRPSWDVKTLEAHIRGRATAGPVGAVLVDYLQRIPPTPGFKADRRDQEVSYIGRTLKTVAVDLEVPVVMGAQINRTPAESLDLKELEAAENFCAAIPTIRMARPELHHLREGGSEQECDVVLGFLNYAADYRTDDAKRSSTPRGTLLEVGTLKNREGEVGAWASLAFEGRYRLVRDATDKEADSWKVDRAPSSAKRDEGRTRRDEVRVEIERERTNRAEKNRQTAALKAAAEKDRLDRTRVQASASTMLPVEPKASSKGRKG
jgi:DNA primase